MPVGQFRARVGAGRNLMKLAQDSFALARHRERVELEKIKAAKPRPPQKGGQISPAVLDRLLGGIGATQPTATPTLAANVPPLRRRRRRI
jgi:hypothetical protein